jgi:hypothetical protein
MFKQGDLKMDILEIVGVFMVISMALVLIIDIIVDNLFRRHK